jgi:AAA domain
MVRELTLDDKARLTKMPKPMFDPPAYLKAIIYGDFGTAKTVTCSTLGRTLVIAGDPGWVSIKNHPDIWKNVTVLPFAGFRQLETLAIALYWQYEEWAEYDTVVIDPIALVQEDYVDDLLRAGKYNKDTRPQFQVTDEKAAADLVIKELPGLDDYHAAKNVLRSPCRDLMKAPLNVIFIAHEREPTREEEKRGTKNVRPDVTEALYKVISRDVHLIGRTSTESRQRIIDFQGTSRQAAKSRIALLNDRQIIVEDFPKAIKKWQGDFAKNWEVPKFDIVT